MSYTKILSRLKAFLKKVTSGLVIVATILGTMGGFAPAVKADDPPQPEFYTTNMFPGGGGASTTLAGEVCFNDAINDATVVAGTSVYVLDGMYDDWRYFNPDNSPGDEYYIDLTALNIANLTAGVGTDPNCIDLSLSSGSLTGGQSYTTVVQAVCMTGHTMTNMETDWPYCGMDYMAFTTSGGAAAAASITAGPDVVSTFLDGSETEYFFPGEINKAIFKFNIYGSDTLSQVKVCAVNTDSYSIVEKITLYRDRTSSIDSNGNHILEPSIDTKLAETTTWAEDGANYCATLTVSPAFTLPSENPNGSLGFIAFDFSSSATLGQYLTPFFVEDSFILSDATINGYMDTAISDIGSNWGKAQITTNAGQASPYIQDLAPAEAIGPMTDVTALGLDFWDAGGAATLTSLTVDIVVPTGGDFDPAYGLNTLSTDNTSGIQLYKDDGTSDGEWDASDTLVALSSAPAWQTLSGFTKRAALTLQVPESQPTNNTASTVNEGPDYFVRVKTSSSPPPGSSFQARIPTNGFTTGFPTADSPSSSINIQTGGGSMPSNIVISEIQTGTGGDEFIELYNPTNASVDLSAYSIQYEETEDTFVKQNFTSGNIIPAYGFFLIAPSGYDGSPPSADLANTQFTNMDATGGTVF